MADVLICANVNIYHCKHSLLYDILNEWLIFEKFYNNIVQFVNLFILSLNIIFSGFF